MWGSIQYISVSYMYWVGMAVENSMAGPVEWKLCLGWGLGEDVSLKNNWHTFLYLLHLPQSRVTQWKGALLTGELERPKDILNQKLHGNFPWESIFSPGSILLFPLWCKKMDKKWPSQSSTAGRELRVVEVTEQSRRIGVMHTLRKIHLCSLGPYLYKKLL